MESVKKLIDKRALHKREKRYDRIRKAGYKQQFRNDADANDADIKPVYDEEPLDEVKLTADNNVLLQDNSILSNLNSTMKEVDQNVEQCHDTRYLAAKLIDNQTTELSN
nr:hypothetical protein [Tanacetum cinerariifolium]